MAILSKSHPRFSVDIFQNEYLAEGAREVNAIVTVTATGGGTSGGLPTAPVDGAGAAVVIMVDCSGSMDYPSAKMRNAREATAAAIDTLRDGVAFAVVAGTHEAVEVYPANRGLAIADDATRGQAKQALRKLTPAGGTAIGTWLTKAHQLFESRADIAIRHGILLTDGRNEHEKPADLQRVLDKVTGRFTVDCRGVGTDWEVAELRKISSTLLGTVDIVAEPSGLAEDFRSMMEKAMGKQVADVALRVWTPANAVVKYVKQVAPDMADLTDRRAEAGPRAGDYPTGSWGDESRDYHVCVEVPAAAVGNEMLAARISLVLPQPDGGSEVLSQGLVKAVWTDDLASSTRISPQVAHYTGQAELASSIQEGLEAHRAGDVDRATAKLGAAVRLAHETGNDGTFKLLQKVVDVVDPKEGTVRFRKNVTEADSMTLETRSTKTVRVKK
ncbi:VWA domain-containing protein [Kitasatospora atroaurantiaca]|uniref:von Willebrand factor type A domain-containing protein n=1 Tax=Kitasatospora atroaurantiaca TaxID=285545 RepID=A0A561EWK5_9ACTN|nr:VWA domain-containing protein [Kitasatospora atroaurantiaca]TWE19973.1 von Willebrand factor type A domain-containing protein [Kitasatospora atroaurantiaca]